MSNLIDILKQDLEEIGVIFPSEESKDYETFKDDLISNLACGDVIYFAFTICKTKKDTFEDNLKKLLESNYKFVYNKEISDEYSESVFKYGDKFYKVVYAHYYSHKGFLFDGVTATTSLYKWKVYEELLKHFDLTEC